jgi:signal transduction histidine kinase
MPFAKFVRCLRVCFPTSVLVSGMILIAVLIGVQTWSASVLTERALHSTESTIYRNVARGLAEKLRIFSEKAPREVLSQRIEELSTINPGVRVYVVNARGIITMSPKAYGPVVIPFISLVPVKKVLEDSLQGEVEYGDDPHSPDRRVPFSVATLRLAGDPHYLYVVTAGTEFGSSFMHAAGKSLALTTFILALGSTAIVVSIIGAIFYRRLKTVSSSIAVLSHDLRGPLTSIQGYLETVIHKGEELNSQESAQFMKVALRSTKSATSMLNDLHHLSKIEAASEEVVIEALSIGDLIMDSVMAVKLQSDEKEIHISVHAPPCTPLVQGNLELLERLVRNLLDNAIRYTPQGGRIDISLHNVPDKVRVAILDNGPGIPSSELDRVTSRFVRGAKVSSKIQGSGIGLSVAAEVARLHGGQLRILSREGEGTVVLFELYKDVTSLRGRRAA